MRRGMLTCTAAEDAEADGVYQLYYDFSQPISRVLDHQILAMNRGEQEGVLKLNVESRGQRDGAALVCRAAVEAHRAGLPWPLSAPPLRTPMTG